MRALYNESAGFQTETWSPDVFDSMAQAERRSTTWSLGGTQVCLANFAHLLGTTQRALWKHISGEPDGRHNKVAAARQSQAVDFYFYELYMSAAESLPSDPAKRIRPGHTVDADITFDNSPWYCVGDAQNSGELTREEEDKAGWLSGWVGPEKHRREICKLK
jgi:hypothetical protein